MKIQPLGNIIQLEFEEAKAGDLLTSSRESAVEYAKIIAIGEKVDITMKKSDKVGEYIKFGVGDYVFVKAWAVDIVVHEDKKYYFVNLDTNGILAIIK